MRSRWPAAVRTFSHLTESQELSLFFLILNLTLSRDAQKVTRLQV